MKKYKLNIRLLGSKTNLLIDFLNQLIKERQEPELDAQQLLFQQQAQPATPATALAKVNIPVLVIAGEEDNDNGTAEALAQLFPKAMVKRTPGVHNTAWQSPKFAQAVLTFLQQVQMP